MKLQGISEKGISRIARLMKSQDLGEPDYGEGNPDKVKYILEEAGAEWTPEGWVVGDGHVWFLNLGGLGLTRLPRFKSINISFVCKNNQLTSLEGAPREVGGDFNCSNNNLTSLEGSPREVGEDFSCSNNNLTSLEGSPREVGEDFSCKNNPGNFTEEDVRAVSNVSGTIYAGVSSNNTSDEDDSNSDIDIEAFEMIDKAGESWTNEMSESLKIAKESVDSGVLSEIISGIQSFIDGDEGDDIYSEMSDNFQDAYMIYNSGEDNRGGMSDTYDNWMSLLQRATRAWVDSFVSSLQGYSGDEVDGVYDTIEEEITEYAGEWFDEYFSNAIRNSGIEV